MAIQQISVFIENKQGKLLNTVKAISCEGINIRAMSIADTQDFGILRMITSDHDRTLEILKEESIVSTTEVIAVKMEDKVGSLYEVMKILSDAGVNIEYMYAFTATESFGAYVIFRVDDVAQAQELLDKSGIPTLCEEDMRAL